MAEMNMFEPPPTPRGEYLDAEALKFPNTPNGVSQVAFDNFGFDVNDEKYFSKSQLKMELRKTENLVQEALKSWQHQKVNIEENHETVKQEIEERRELLISLVNHHADLLLKQLHQRIQPHNLHARSTLDNLEEIGKDIAHLHKTDFKPPANYMFTTGENNNMDDNRIYYKHLMKEVQEINLNVNKHASIWLPLELQAPVPSEYLISHLFGNVQLKSKDSFPLRECENVHQVKKFFAKTKSNDLQPSGVVDVAMNQRGDIYIADKGNKKIKMYDKNGKFQQIIGQNVLMEPIRIAALRNSQHLLVIDNFNRIIKMFTWDGEFVKIFINNLKYPTSLCESYNGNILITEYESHSVLVYDPVTGMPTHSFPIHMSIPSNMACGPQGNIVITDWRSHALKLFSSIGEMVTKVQEKGAGAHQLDHPQGACFDALGNMLIADSSNNRIKLYNNQGKFIKILLGKSAALKLPMAVHVDHAGLLYVVEYQGVVKIFKYLEATNPQKGKMNGSKDQQHSSSEGTSDDDSDVSDSEVHLKHKEKCEETCL